MNIDIDLNYGYLHTLRKDELIELLLTVNNETLKNKREILKEAVMKDGFDTNGYGRLYMWLSLCNNPECSTLVSTDGGCFNYGFECKTCDDVYCKECDDKYRHFCEECGHDYCKNCNMGIEYEKCEKCYRQNTSTENP